MEHYLTEENCRIEKKHYSVLLRLVREWEEQFWSGQEAKKENIAFSGRVFAGIELFKQLNVIAAATLDFLYNRELAGLNPMLA